MKSDSLFYTKDEIDQDQTICQYMDLDYLLLMLSTNKYFIRFKGSFRDGFEKSLPLKYMFPVYLAGSVPEQAKMKEDLEKMHDKLAAYKEMRNVPTSCWTLNERESVLMWLAYTSKIGVCVKSTVSKFVSAIDYSDYELLCGKMAYHGYSLHQDDEIFSKDASFADEKEIRFYFLPEKDFECDQTGVYLPIENPKAMLNEVILSPQISPKAASELCDMLKGKYGLNFSPSKIRLF